MPDSDATKDLIELATAEAAGAQAEAVEPIHLLIAVCRSESPQLAQTFDAYGIDQVRFRRRVRGFARQVSPASDDGPRRVSGRVRHLVELAGREAGTLLRPVDAICVFVALLRNPDAPVKQVLEIERVPAADMIEYLRRMLTRIGPEPAPREVSGSATPVLAPAPVLETTPTPTLDAYGKDYTALARAGAFDPVVGRRDEIKQVVRVLLRKQRNNPVLVGDPGVGKTRIVEGLAMRAVGDGVPEAIAQWRVVEIQPSTLAAGAQSRAEAEDRLARAVAEAEATPGVVLFFDEIHAILDAAGVLKPALARGRLRCVGATTPAEYRRHVASEPALERRLQPIPVEEPTPDEAREVLAGLRETYETYHGVEVSDAAIEAAVDLSVRYVPDRRLPDKACDLIDQAAAAKRFMTFSGAEASPKGTPFVSADDVVRVVSEWTGLPIERLMQDGQERVRRLEQALGRRVVGQAVAVATVARVVRTGLAGLSRPEHPRAVLLFVGPPGVGKTETARALAECLFDDERRLVRFDASVLADERGAARLVGPRPGDAGSDEGGALVDAVRRAPHSVVLFEEVERAHPRVLDLLQQLVDHGRLADSHGRVADFRNALVILTSNIGSSGPCVPPIEGGDRHADGTPHSGEVDSPDELRRELLEHIRPELLGRVSRIVPFRALDLADVRAVIDHTVDRLREERLRDKGVGLRLAPSAYDALVDLGYDPQCGVREMERVVERQIVEPLAQGLIDGRFRPGDEVEVAADGASLVLRVNGGQREGSAP